MVHNPGGAHTPPRPPVRTALRDLSRLYLCLEWMRQQGAYDALPGGGQIHTAVDADVAINWVRIKREVPRTEFFGAPELGRLLMERLGQRLFLADESDPLRTRMSREHAIEVSKKVDPRHRFQPQALRLYIQRLTRRDRQLTPHELDAVRQFVEQCEAVQRGLDVASGDLRAPELDTPLHVNDEQIRLELLLNSPRLGLITPQWYNRLLANSPLNEDRLETRRRVWLEQLRDARRLPPDAEALEHRAQRDANDADDAETLALIEEINTCLQERSPKGTAAPHRILLITGSSFVFRVVQQVQGSGPPEDVFVRHPLIYLITESTRTELPGLQDGRKHDWTGFRSVFESYLQSLAEGTALSSEDKFWRAFQLSWPPRFEPGAGFPKLSGESALLAESKLQQAYDECLMLAQVLRARLETEDRMRAAAEARETPAPRATRQGQVTVLELLNRLRILETSGVDSLLQQIIGGVLSLALANSGDGRDRAIPWQRVPVLKLEPGSSELQQFMIHLRTQPQEFLLRDGVLAEWRHIAQKQPLRYVSLVLDALILCAFEQWSAAVSMARRALERAALYQQRDFPGSLQAGSPEADVWRKKQLMQLRYVDGREANFVAAHACRHSAASLPDLEDAARYLAVFRGMAEEDLRGPSEDLALSLAEWTILHYEGGSAHTGRLLAIRRRLQQLHARHHATRLNPGAAAADPVDHALFRFVWEQTLVNLCIVTIEGLHQRLPADPGELPPDQIAERLLDWIKGEGAGEQALFPTFISHVACVLFMSAAQAEARGLSQRTALDCARQFAEQSAPESLGYHAQRVRRFNRLLRQSGPPPL